MITQFISYIEYYTPLSETAKEDLFNLCEEKHVAKGDLLLNTEYTCNHLFFLCEGVARTFYYLDGKDVTSWIYDENSMLTSWYSFFRQSPALENIEAVTDIKVVSISYENLQQLFEKHVDFERFGRLEMQEQLAFIDEMYHNFMFLTAKQKYDRLLEMFPNLTRIIKLGHIASMLGISQETLSRIRKMP